MDTAMRTRQMQTGSEQPQAWMPLLWYTLLVCALALLFSDFWRVLQVRGPVQQLSGTPQIIRLSPAASGFQLPPRA